MKYTLCWQAHSLIAHFDAFDSLVECFNFFTPINMKFLVFL